MNDYIEINTDNIEPPKESDNIFEARSNAAVSFSQNEADLSIAVISYNRLEKTKDCVESLIKHTEIPFKLILIDSGSEPDVLEYYKSVEYNDKQIIRITKNINANYSFWIAINHMKSRFCTIVSNDIIVTPKAIENLYRCITSSNDIGWVSPVSSNVSNLQQVYLEYDTIEEMHEKAKEYNKSDPSKWYEKTALMPPIILYRKECMDIVGGFDYGFFHDFADDDMSRRVNRAGYKTILCKDTWVHHNHNYQMDDEQKQKFKASIQSGKENYKQKYHGLDAWDDLRNYEIMLLSMLRKPEPRDSIHILGVDVRCGAPIMQIRNKLREFGIFETTSEVFTTQAKYFADLQSICQNVNCDRIDYIDEYIESKRFDYIILGEPINTYHKPFNLLKKLFGFLNHGGSLLFKLKNNVTVETLRYSFGEYMAILSDNPSICVSAEAVGKYLISIGATMSPIVLEYIAKQKDELKNAKDFIDTLRPSENNLAIATRLLAQNYLFLAEKL